MTSRNEWKIGAPLTAFYATYWYCLWMAPLPAMDGDARLRSKIGRSGLISPSDIRTRTKLRCVGFEKFQQGCYLTFLPSLLFYLNYWLTWSPCRASGHTMSYQQKGRMGKMVKHASREGCCVLPSAIERRSLWRYDFRFNYISTYL